MQMTGRERKMVIFAGVALVVFVVVQFLVYPLVDHRARLQKRLAGKEKALGEMHLLQQQFRQLNRQSGSMGDMLDQREQGFSLFAFLEQKADESNVKEQITYMKPSESMEGEKFTQSRVEMKLQGVSLERLLNFVKATESPSNLVGVAKMTIQENSKDQGMLDATLLMVSVERPANAEER